jgi:hypothetical protein
MAAYALQIIIITFKNYYCWYFRNCPYCWNLVPVIETLQTQQAFIRGILSNNNSIVLEIDDVEFLDGEEAILKAMEDSKCSREKIEECVPSLNNGFYIRNVASTTKQYTLSPEADVALLLGGSPERVTSSPQELVAEFNKSESILKHVPFAVTTQGNTITTIEQQYLP